MHNLMEEYGKIVIMQLTQRSKVAETTNILQMMQWQKDSSSI